MKQTTKFATAFALSLLLVSPVYASTSSSSTSIESSSSYTIDTRFLPRRMQNETVQFMNPNERQFPTIEITTTGEGEPFAIRDLWITANITVDGVADSGSIRGRGNTSWFSFPDKRPLRLRFDSHRQMFDSPATHRDWILLALQSDPSLMRNFALKSLSEGLPGIYWSPFTHFVHLYVNDEYMGVYMLTDERNVTPGRAVLVADSDPSVSEFFLELDWRLYRQNRRERSNSYEWEDFVRVNAAGIINDSHSNNSYGGRFYRDFLYEVLFPGSSIRTLAHMEYVQEFMTHVHTSIRNQDWQEFSSLVYMPSFVDFYLIHEIFKNVDTGASSQFMQIKNVYIPEHGYSRRLVMGPVWDFDLTSGNNIGRIESPYDLYATLRHVWWHYLMDMPEFFELVSERFNTYAFDATQNTIAEINRIANTYTTDFEHNFTRHEILGTDIWPGRTPYAIQNETTFLGQVDILTDFLYRRINWLNDFLN